MDAISYLKERERICNRFAHSPCMYCPFDGNCSSLEKSEPSEAVRIVEEWSKEHPATTNADKFKEVFGVEPKRPKLNGVVVHEKGMSDEWWDEPYEDR